MNTLVNSKIGESSNIVDNYYSRLFVVDNRQENKLGDFVRQTRNDKRLSVKDVSIRANGQISAAYVNRIENEFMNLSVPKQQALAKGLGVPEEKIYELVRGVEITDEDLERVELEAMYRKRRNLSPAKKEAFRRLLDMVDRELDRMMDEKEEDEKSLKN